MINHQFRKIQEILLLIYMEILHFGHLEAEKIEFEVGRSNFKKLENFTIFDIFLICGQNTKCPSDAEFSQFLKTDLTFDPSPFLFLELW